MAALEDLLGAGQTDNDLIEVAVELYFLLHVVALLACVLSKVALTQWLTPMKHSILIHATHGAVH